MDFESCYNDAVSSLSEELRSVLLSVNSNLKSECTEVRIRVNKPLVIACGNKKCCIDFKGAVVRADEGYICTKDAMKDSFSRICDYSVHTHSSELIKGFVTVKGGHRIGVTGTAAVDAKNNITAVRDVSSLCIRIAKEIKGSAVDIYESIFSDNSNNVIIAGPPSSGKTTILRDLIRILSENGSNVCVIDERQEIASMYKGLSFNDVGLNTDVYYGYPKESAINIAVRTMSPDVVAVDEICDDDEIKAVVRAANCGVQLMVTMHATDLKDLVTKYQSLSLLRTGVFEKIVILGREGDKRTKTVYGIEEINDEFYRRRTDMDILFADGNKRFGAF